MERQVTRTPGTEMKVAKQIWVKQSTPLNVEFEIDADDLIKFIRNGGPIDRCWALRHAEKHMTDDDIMKMAESLPAPTKELGEKLVTLGTKILEAVDRAEA